MSFKKQVDIENKLKQNIGTITRKDILEALGETEKIAQIDWNIKNTISSRVDSYKKVEKKVKWLDENLKFDRIHLFLREGICINKSMFTERQYNCFIAALLNLKGNKFAASFHEIYDFIENYKICNTDELTDLEILILSIWSYLFKKNFKKFMDDVACLV